MTRAQYFQVAQVLSDMRPNDETGTVSEKRLFSTLVNGLSDNLFDAIHDGSGSYPPSLDIRGFRDLAAGVRTTPPRRVSQG